MQSKAFSALTPAEVAALSVRVQRVQQFGRWRLVLNGETLVRSADEVDVLRSDLERIGLWLGQAGCQEFVVSLREST